MRKEKGQPTCKELGLSVKETGISHAVIVDGEIKKEELRASGRTEAWLKGALRAQGVSPEEVFLFAVDDGGEVVCIPKKNTNNIKGRKK